MLLRTHAPQVRKVCQVVLSTIMIGRREIPYLFRFPVYAKVRIDATQGKG